MWFIFRRWEILNAIPWINELLFEVCKGNGVRIASGAPGGSQSLHGGGPGTVAGDWRMWGEDARRCITLCFLAHYLLQRLTSIPSSCRNSILTGPATTSFPCSNSLAQRVTFLNGRWQVSAGGHEGHLVAMSTDLGGWIVPPYQLLRCFFRTASSFDETRELSLLIHCDVLFSSLSLLSGFLSLRCFSNLSSPNSLL